MNIEALMDALRETGAHDHQGNLVNLATSVGSAMTQTVFESRDELDEETYDRAIKVIGQACYLGGSLSTFRIGHKRSAVLSGYVVAELMRLGASTSGGAEIGASEEVKDEYARLVEDTASKLTIVAPLQLHSEESIRALAEVVVSGGRLNSAMRNAELPITRQTSHDADDKKWLAGAKIISVVTDLSTKPHYRGAEDVVGQVAMLLDIADDTELLSEDTTIKQAIAGQESISLKNVLLVSELVNAGLEQALNVLNNEEDEEDEEDEE